ncbi:MAG TPA: pilus assembly protein PilN [Sedimenticola sp.]|nr:pilus assembly protein PilN [Sedimenticola sp.]
MARINLLPWRENLRKKRQRDFGIALLISLVLVALGAGAAHFYIEGMIKHQQQRNRYLKTEIAKMDKKIKEIKALEKTKAKLIARMNVIQELQSSRPQVVHLFDEIVNTIPDGVYLTKLEQKGRRLTLSGRAQSNARVSAYMRNIERSEFLEKPNLQVISNKSKSGAGSSVFTLKAKQKIVTRKEDAQNGMTDGQKRNNKKGRKGKGGRK